MPDNKPSWNRLMKDPDFYKKFKLNTNPVYGRTFIPIDKPDGWREPKKKIKNGKR